LKFFIEDFVSSSNDCKIEIEADDRKDEYNKIKGSHLPDISVSKVELI
jgi:hypothetical protein